MLTDSALSQLALQWEYISAFQPLFVQEVTPPFNVSPSKNPLVALWYRLILYTSGHSAPQLRFHISPQSTCEAAEQSSVKWQPPLQLPGLAAVVKPAQHFSSLALLLWLQHGFCRAIRPSWNTCPTKHSAVQPLLRTGKNALFTFWYLI